MWENVWGDDGRQAVASVRVEKRRLEGCAFLPCGVSLPRGQRKDGNPFKALRYGRAASVPTEKKQFAHTLIRLLSVVSIPEENPLHAEGKPRFLSVASALSEKSSVRFPEVFCAGCFPERSKKSPLPCALRVRFAVAFVPRLREGICVVPRVRRCPRSPGHAGIRAQLRAPSGCLRAGRGDRSRTPSRHRNALDRAGRASEQDAGPFMTKESAAGRNAFSGTA